jgi:hypothetical protein
MCRGKVLSCLDPTYNVPRKGLVLSGPAYFVLWVDGWKYEMKGFVGMGKESTRVHARACLDDKRKEKAYFRDYA